MTSSQRICLLLLTLGALASFALPPAAYAAWPHDPAVNLGVGVAANEQRNPASASDGAGGAIVAWEDLRVAGNANIYVQRISAAGAPLWGVAASGLAVCGAAGNQQQPVVCGDGTGGAFIAWADLRSGTWAIYAQHINAAGAVQWLANGLVLGSTLAFVTSGTAAEYNIATDTQGGAYVAWATSANELRIQRLNGAGTTLFAAGGIVLENTRLQQYYVGLVPDGSGGAIASWQAYLSGQQYQILAQRVTSAGAVLWPAGGLGVTSNPAGHQLPLVAADGTGGAIFAWSDYRAFPSLVYAQHISAAGAALWAANGIIVGNAANQASPDAIASDGSGGAIIAFDDVPNRTLYAQRLSFNGAAMWGTNGTVVAASPQYYGYGTLVADGLGGAIVEWIDKRTGGQDVYGQRLSASGISVWAYGGLAISTEISNQVLALYSGLIPPLAADGAGGAIFAWADSRSDVGDIYTQRVERFGKLGNPEPVVTKIRDVLADQGGQVSLQWTASYLDAAPAFEVAQYSLWRQAPAAAAQAALRRGAELLADGQPARPVPAGARIFRAQPAVNGTTYWEYLVTVPARALTGYSHVTPTTTDSMGTSNLLTGFMVMAEDFGGNPFWASAPDSGYSVDNLPPVVPAPFAGAYLAGATRLHWGANPDADFAGYRLYRGSSSGFVPGPASLVVAKPDTGYADPGPAGGWYKLAAVDAHGNESGYATLGPAGTLDVAPPAAPRELALVEPYPSPARGRSVIAFALPRSVPVRLGIFGVDGRLVRTLWSGGLESGTHALPFDLRDASGRALAGGLYFVRLEAEGRSLVKRLVVAP
jgi:hypothetical protein